MLKRGVKLKAMKQRSVGCEILCGKMCRYKLFKLCLLLSISQQVDSELLTYKDNGVGIPRIATTLWRISEISLEIVRD